MYKKKVKQYQEKHQISSVAAEIKAEVGSREKKMKIEPKNKNQELGKKRT